jgi:hypothetical protein
MSNDKMIDAFEAHFWADWRDPAVERERDCWRAAWSAATARQEPCDMGPLCIGCTPRVDGVCPGAAQPLTGEVVTTWTHADEKPTKKDA